MIIRIIIMIIIVIIMCMTIMFIIIRDQLFYGFHPLQPSSSLDPQPQSPGSANENTAANEDGAEGNRGALARSACICVCICI